MLAAAAEALAPSQQLERLDLERQELTVIKENFLNVATQASCLYAASKDGNVVPF